MNRPLFKINRLGAQDKSQTYDSILTNTILADISRRIFSINEYDVEWKNERNQGRMITCEFNNVIAYINLSQNGHVEGRNYYFQSVCTAIGIYLNDKKKIKDKKSEFYFYFLPFTGENKTEYHKFQYRVMATAGIKFLNPDYGLSPFIANRFNSVKDIILTRNELRKRNIANQSTYITDEGESYNLYGKTFGANQKETTLLCLALTTITDKPIKLFQITDNGSTTLSDKDIEAITEYSRVNGESKIEILDDSYQFDDDDSDSVKDNLRSPKFIYNLLQKYKGEKKCALCGCKIESIVQAAHIYPVAEIRRRFDLEIQHKIALAIDKDNGLWLCENHHKLFDRGLIWFEEGCLCIAKHIHENDSVFIKQITTIEVIDSEYLNERMLAFFDMRAGIPARLVI